jgi:hypothetical protein
MVNQALSTARLAFLVLVDTYLNFAFEDIGDEHGVLSKDSLALKSVEFLLNPVSILVDTDS